MSREFLFSSHSLSRDFVYVHHTFALTPSLSPVQEFPKIPSRYSSTRSFYKIDVLHALRQQRIYYPWPIFFPASTLFLLLVTQGCLQLGPEVHHLILQSLSLPVMDLQLCLRQGQLGSELMGLILVRWAVVMQQ